MRDFVRSIGFITSIIVEFWALRDGLLQAVQIGVQNLLIEFDAKVVVELIQSIFPSNAFYSSLLADCSRSLLGRFQHYKLQNAFRKVNRVANVLANLGCEMQEQFVILDIPPPDDISAFVHSNAIGERFCRLTASNLAILA